MTFLEFLREHALEEDYYVGARHFSDKEAADHYAKTIGGVVTPQANPDHKGFKSEKSKAAPGKLFPGMDDSHDSHGHRMASSVTSYDMSKKGKPGHNPYAISHYLGAVHKAKKGMERGLTPAQAIDHHFTGALANRLHKHLGTGEKHDPFRSVTDPALKAYARKYRDEED